MSPTLVAGTRVSISSARARPMAHQRYPCEEEKKKKRKESRCANDLSEKEDKKKKKETSPRANKLSTAKSSSNNLNASTSFLKVNAFFIKLTFPPV